MWLARKAHYWRYGFKICDFKMNVAKSSLIEGLYLYYKLRMRNENFMLKVVGCRLFRIFACYLDNNNWNYN